MTSSTIVVLSVISARETSCPVDTVGAISYIYQRILGFCASCISKTVMLIILERDTCLKKIYLMAGQQGERVIVRVGELVAQVAASALKWVRMSLCA